MNGTKKSLLNGMLIACMVSLFLAPTFAETVSSHVYLQLVGTVNKYGNHPAMGCLRLLAKDGAWARADVLFFTPRWWRIPETFPATGVHIYGFRLVNASIVEVRRLGAYIEGNWIGFHIFWDGSSIRSLVEALKNAKWIKTRGNLTIADAYTVFKISLEGLEPIAGAVVRSRIITITTEDVPEGDFNFDGVVDIRDIALAAKAYGSMMVDFRYDMQADVNFDFQVDIRDVASVCRNYGKRY